MVVTPSTLFVPARSLAIRPDCITISKVIRPTREARHKFRFSMHLRPYEARKYDALMLPEVATGIHSAIPRVIESCTISQRRIIHRAICHAPQVLLPPELR